jgi:hypothetical protein
MAIKLFDRSVRRRAAAVTTAVHSAQRDGIQGRAALIRERRRRINEIALRKGEARGQLASQPIRSRAAIVKISLCSPLDGKLKN